MVCFHHRLSLLTLAAALIPSTIGAALASIAYGRGYNCYSMYRTIALSKTERCWRIAAGVLSIEKGIYD